MQKTTINKQNKRFKRHLGVPEFRWRNIYHLYVHMCMQISIFPSQVNDRIVARPRSRSTAAVAAAAAANGHNLCVMPPSSTVGRTASLQVIRNSTCRMPKVVLATDCRTLPCPSILMTKMDVPFWSSGFEGPAVAGFDWYGRWHWWWWRWIKFPTVVWLTKIQPTKVRLLELYANMEAVTSSACIIEWLFVRGSQNMRESNFEICTSAYKSWKTLLSSIFKSRTGAPI